MTIVHSYVNSREDAYNIIMPGGSVYDYKRLVRVVLARVNFNKNPSEFSVSTKIRNDSGNGYKLKYYMIITM